MDLLVGTPQCPHLGFSASGGVPCCRADEAARRACGRFAPNPKARGLAGTEAQARGVEPFYCTVLGTETLPPEALRLAARGKAAAKKAAPPSASGYQAPAAVTGRPAPRRSRQQDPSADQPVIPTHILRNEGRQTRPNDRCPCGSGRKFKRCCGRGGWRGGRG